MSWGSSDFRPFLFLIYNTNSSAFGSRSGIPIIFSQWSKMQCETAFPWVFILSSSEKPNDSVLKLVRKAIADLLKIMAMNQAFNCFAYTLINWHNLLGLPSTLCFPSFQFLSQFRWTFQLSLSFSLSFWSFPNLLCKFSI